MSAAVARFAIIADFGLLAAVDKPPYGFVDPRVTVSPPANCNGPNYAEHDPKIKASPKKKGSRR